ELADLLQIDADRVREMMAWRQETVSLEGLADRKPHALEAALTRDCSPDDDLSVRTLRDDLRGALEKLNARERAVLLLRFGLSDLGPMTLEEVGQRFGVTRE